MLSPKFHIFFAAVVLLTALSPAASTEPATSAATAQSAIDVSTPAAAYNSLLRAIDQDDWNTVADLVAYPVQLSGPDRELMARHVILGSKIWWALNSQFDQKTAASVERQIGVAFLPRVDAHTLQFIARTPFNNPNRPDILESAMAESAQGVVPRIVVMCRTASGWKLNRAAGGAERFARILDDVRWQNERQRKVLADLNAGNATPEALIKDVTVAVAAPTTAKSPTDRTIPDNVYAALTSAIAAGDVAAAADCFEGPTPGAGDLPRIYADFYVSVKKMNHFVSAKFDARQATRLIHDCFLQVSTPFQQFENLQWEVDGDVARGIFKGHYFSARLIRRSGLWRIELSPATLTRLNSTQPTLERLRADNMAQRTQKMHDILAHPDRYTDPGSILDALRPEYMQPHDHTAQRQQELAQVLQARKDLDSKKTTIPPADRAAAEAMLSIESQALAAPDESYLPAAIFFVAGDKTNQYALARSHRCAAAAALVKAVNREVDDNGGALLSEFQLTDPADEIMGMGFIDVTWTVNGDVATAKVPPESHAAAFPTPTLRRVGTEWKIDVTDETGGDSAPAATRAEHEAVQIEEITHQVNDRKILTLDDVRSALRSDQIRGIEQ